MSVVDAPTAVEVIKEWLLTNNLSPHLASLLAERTIKDLQDEIAVLQLDRVGEEAKAKS